MTRNDEWARVNAHVKTFTGRTEESHRKIVRQGSGFQLGFELCPPVQEARIQASASLYSSNCARELSSHVI